MSEGKEKTRAGTGGGSAAAAPGGTKPGEYGAESIQVLEGLEGVRRRPGMYIGDTGKAGLHHLLWEILDNAVDEALAGFCRKIDVTLGADGSASVTDDGRGMPTGMHEGKQMPAVDVIFTVLHAGGKFDSRSYAFSGGLHGVGASVVNALSKWVRVEVRHGDGYVWNREYAGGKPVGRLTKRRSAGPAGTSVEFLPDPEVFRDAGGFDADKIVRRINEVSYLLPGLKITFTDCRSAPTAPEAAGAAGGGADPAEAEETGEELRLAKPPAPGVKLILCNPKGPAGLVLAAAGGELLTSRRSVFCSSYASEEEGWRADVAFGYTKGYGEKILSFVNLIPTEGGGSHVTGFRSALTKAVNTAGRKSGLLKDKVQNVTGAELQEGLLAVVSVFMKDPQFEGQTKGRLGGGEAEQRVYGPAYDALVKYFEACPKELKTIIDKALLSRKAREKARAAVELVRHGTKNSLAGRLELPAKLASCTSRDSAKCELFLVEGDSAGGSAKQARDREFQAIMPLRGKILNCHKADLKKIVSNAEIKAMIQILGCGTRDSYDESKLRYGKIIFLTDADVDGSHISCLLITFFYNIIPQLLKSGRIYVAQPPLYSLKRGREGIEYFYSDAQLQERLEKLKRAGGRRGADQAFVVQRYKGLGEMNPEQLWKTTMDPAARTLRRVTVHDWEAAAGTIDLLMGESAEARRRWIMERGAGVLRLDV